MARGGLRHLPGARSRPRRGRDPGERCLRVGRRDRPAPSRSAPRPRHGRPRPLRRGGSARGRRHAGAGQGGYAHARAAPAASAEATQIGYTPPATRWTPASRQPPRCVRPAVANSNEGSNARVGRLKARRLRVRASAEATQIGDTPAAAQRSRNWAPGGPSTPSDPAPPLPTPGHAPSIGRQRSVTAAGQARVRRRRAGLQLGDRRAVTARSPMPPGLQPGRRRSRRVRGRRLRVL